MNKEKQTYLSPETETLVVRFEGMVCTSPTVGANGLQGGNVINGSDSGFSGWDD